MPKSVWETGKLQEVFHPVGRRENGEIEYRRGGFDLLEWKRPGGTDPEVFALPVSIGSQFTGTGISVETNDERGGVEFGYYSPERHIFEANEADGKKDSWRSLHGFGLF